jgi:hypothetical protein
MRQVARRCRSGPAWLRDLFGEDIFATVEGVEFASSSVTDADLEHLKGISQIHFLLFVGATKITDAGLGHFKGLSQLQMLELFGTQVTDAGLVHLKGLTQLRSLNLADTRVTPAGAAELERVLPKCGIVGLEQKAK